MQISNLVYKPRNINFKSTNRSVNDEKGKYDYSNYTFFFRDDIKSWDKFTEDLINKYKNQDKVNVYCYACSDGSEPYSLAMMLISKLGEKGAQKFFPIIAKDKDNHYINRAQQGKVDLYKEDLRAIKLNTGKEYSEYLDIVAEFPNSYRAKFKPNVKDAVVFEQGDILDDLDSIEEDNSVVLFRNAWHYLREKQSVLAYKISHRLGENSMLILGSYDKHNSKALELLDSEDLHRIDTDTYIGYENVFGDTNCDINNPEYLYSVYVGKKY